MSLTQNLPSVRPASHCIPNFVSGCYLSDFLFHLHICLSSCPPFNIQHLCFQLGLGPPAVDRSHGVFLGVFSLRLHIAQHSRLYIDFSAAPSPSSARLPALPLAFPLHFFTLGFSPPVLLYPSISIFSYSFSPLLALCSLSSALPLFSPAFLSPFSAFIFAVPCHSSRDLP